MEDVMTDIGERGLKLVDLTDDEQRMKEDDFTHYYNATIRLNAKVKSLTAQVERLTKALLEISSIDDCMTDETGSLPASYLMRGIAIHSLGKDVS
jgi:hypothetical protein